jgi:hypothetical protein
MTTKDATTSNMHIQGKLTFFMCNTNLKIFDRQNSKILKSRDTFENSFNNIRQTSMFFRSTYGLFLSHAKLMKILPKAFLLKHIAVFVVTVPLYK